MNNPLYKQDAFQEYLYLARLSDTSQKLAIKNVTYFMAWTEKENMQLQMVGYNDILAYMNHCQKKGQSQRTVQIAVNNLKHYYAFLVQQREVTENPCTNIIVQGIKRRSLYEPLTPEELRLLYTSYRTEPLHNTSDTKLPPQALNTLARKRNKIVLGLLVYQGLRTEEVSRLHVCDVQIHSGSIFIEAAKKSESRTLPFDIAQVADMIEYLNTIRPHMLQLTGIKTNSLFITTGAGTTLDNVMQRIVKEIKAHHTYIENMKQLRASVISNWLKVHDIRKVQHMAGHRFVSSTERYILNNLDDLKRDIIRFHPDF